MEGLYSMGYKQPSPIQQQAIPAILKHRDLIACAQTGTGKTAAYLLPVINHIIRSSQRHLNALVIAPTRELAMQIDQQAEGMGYFCGVSSIAVYGGGDGVTWEQQKNALKQGADIIIATPGRLIALLQAGDINFDHLQHLVLDEADRMLDMGFYDDIMRIIKKLPAQRQTLLFSATMPPKMRMLAKSILKDPAEINIAISKPAEGINQQAYLVYDSQKEPLLMKIMKNEEYQSIIIFCSTKDHVKKLERDLRRQHTAVKAFHSDLEQAEREELMREFKSKKLRVLVGTDVLSRGIDVEGISLVVNYDAPPDPEDYVHRIGRTARAAASGTAITFVNEKDQQKFARIEALIGKEVPKMTLPPELGEGPQYHPHVKKNPGEKKQFRRRDGPRRKFHRRKNS